MSTHELSDDEVIRLTVGINSFRDSVTEMIVELLQVIIDLKRKLDEPMTATTKALVHTMGATAALEMMRPALDRLEMLVEGIPDMVSLAAELTADSVEYAETMVPAALELFKATRRDDLLRILTEEG